MSRKDEILGVLSRIKEALSRYGVSRVGLFGSVARGEALESSDIDILIDFNGDNETYGNFMSACELIENALKGQKVDIVTYKGLSPYIGEHILNEVVYV